MVRLETKEEIKKFIFKGDAVLKVRSTATDKMLTYRIKRSPNNKSMYLVEGLIGANIYGHIGYIQNELFTHSSRAKIKADNKLTIGFNYMFVNVMYGFNNSKIEYYK